ncbi:MAG: TIM barrel protein [Lachnospiraceae bacterium]|nr:TIM barrel protein [Lachnospiraceae bacterium]
MDIICAPQGIVDSRHPRQGLSDISAAGFQGVLLDMSLVCLPEELENLGKSGRKTARMKQTALLAEHPEELQDSIAPVLEQCKKEELQCPVAMAPYLERGTKRADLNVLLERLAAESIRTCGQAGCQYIIIPPLSAGIAEGALWEQNRAYYLRLAETAKQCRVQILLENQCRDFNGHLLRGLCSDSTQAAAWVDALNEAVGEERFGFCMDAGVCSLCGQNMYDVILQLGSRLKAVILRDCDGSGESALLPFTAVKKGQSQTDWLNLLRGLRETGFDGGLLLNFGDTAAAFSPLLRPELLRLAKSVAEYFKWQIEIENLLKRYPSRVLFGAGNMCRNYMKCYGEKYPPLFTCDNNEKLWGTEFSGLSVREPEALRELPEDCAVFICNIYYREIEAQIREMGIPNPIEFFNDEYMPTFHFDRIERG